MLGNNSKHFSLFRSARLTVCAAFGVETSLRNDRVAGS